jgi:hypothetical protein
VKRRDILWLSWFLYIGDKIINIIHNKKRDIPWPSIGPQ